MLDGMSSDNYWVVVPNPDGGFSPVMGFASSDEYLDPEDVPVPGVGAPVFETAEAALASVLGDWAEYGHSIHESCGSGEPMDLRAAVDSARERLSTARCDLERVRSVAALVEARMLGVVERGETPDVALLREWAGLLGDATGWASALDG